MRTIVGRTVILGVGCALTLGLWVGAAAPATADNTPNQYIYWNGCAAQTYHVRNLYGYAVAQTWIYSGYSSRCYYAYVKVDYGPPYGNGSQTNAGKALVTSPYQTSPYFSTHYFCTSNFSACSPTQNLF